MPAVQDSILDTTKKILGLDADYDAFDVDVITHINSVFATLHQLGVGPAEPMEIEDSSTLWSAFIGGNKKINSVKSYMFLKVKTMFDTANMTSFDLAAKKELINELEWRLNVAAETYLPVENGGMYSSGAFFWTLEGENVWPPEAQEGDLGIYPPSGNVWRKR